MQFSVTKNLFKQQAREPPPRREKADWNFCYAACVWNRAALDDAVVGRDKQRRRRRRCLANVFLTVKNTGRSSQLLLLAPSVTDTTRVCVCVWVCALSLSMCALSQKYWEILQEGKGKMQAASLLGKLSIRTVAAAGQPSDSALAAPVNRCDCHTHTHRHSACAAPTTCVFCVYRSPFFVDYFLVVAAVHLLMARCG